MALEVLHYPRLDTILGIEKVLKRSGTPLSKNEIGRRLKKQVMRPTLNVILAYLEESGKVALTKKGALWIFKGDASKKLQSRLEKSVRVL